MINETDAHALEELQQDVFSTLRMKKLICIVVGEFKSFNNNQNLNLNEEELQSFNFYNNPNKDPLHQNALDPTREFLKKKNFQLLGTNADDLRKFIIHTF